MAYSGSMGFLKGCNFFLFLLFFIMVVRKVVGFLQPSNLNTYPWSPHVPVHWTRLAWSSCVCQRKHMKQRQREMAGSAMDQSRLHFGKKDHLRSEEIGTL